MTTKFTITTNKEVTKINVKSHDSAFVSALRRTLISSIPTYSVDIDSIDIKENNTIYHNERIAHILTSIYVNNNTKFKYDDVTFSLDSKDKKIVYSHDIKSSDNNLYFHPNVPIIELKKGDKLVINSFKLKKDVQRTHSQFQACIVQYRPETFPLNVDLKISPCSICDGISYPYDTKTVAKMAFSVLKEKINNLKQNIINDNAIIESVKCNDSNLTTIILNNENDTLGYLIQSHIMNMKDFNNFIGYKNIHPLKHKLLIKLIHDKPKELLVKTLTELEKLLPHV